MRAALLAGALLLVGPGPIRAQSRPAVEPGAQTTEDQLLDVAELFVTKGQPDKAIQLYEELLKERPGDARVRVRLAEACLESARCQPRRMALLEDALAASGGRRDLLEDLSSLMAAAGRHKLAAAVLRSYLAKHPGVPSLRGLLVDALVASGDAPGALREVRLYLRARPRDFEARWLEIELLERLGRGAEVDRLLLAYVREQPRSGDAWVAIAERALERGDLPATDAALLSARRGDFVDKDGPAQLAAVAKDVTEEREQRRRDLAERFRDFRRDARWADLADDLEGRDDY